MFIKVTCLLFQACGSRVTTPTGIIRSPFWPGYYPIKRSCSYIIDSVSGSNIVLDFLNLKLAQTGTCEDYIQASFHYCGHISIDA